MMPAGLDKIKGARILVVEDSIVNQTLARDLLKHAGCHVDLAGNGKEAIAALRNASEPYDAVLMDLQMPIMDGLEATAIIRKELSLDSLPVIATTANIGKKDQELCLAAGANDCLPKPFHIEELYAVMIRWAGADTRTAPRANGSEKVAGASENDEIPLPEVIDGVDIPDGLSRVAEDRKLYADLLVGFSESSVKQRDEIDDAFDNGDFDRVGFLAHGIKSTAGNIGAGDLSAAAAEVEKRIAGDADGIDDAFDRFRMELEKVIAGIQAANISVPRRKPKAAGGKGFDRHEAETLIGKLLEMLDEQDLGAQRELEKLSSLLVGRGHDETLEELGDNLDALEFAAARKILAQAGKELLG